MSDKPVFEDKPRWKGAPRICLKTNLPAFESEKERADFEKTNCPGYVNFIKWRCRHCGQLHYYGSASDPAGGSSGAGRSSKLKASENFIANLKKTFNIRLQ